MMGRSPMGAWRVLPIAWMVACTINDPVRFGDEPVPMPAIPTDAPLVDARVTEISSVCASPREAEAFDRHYSVSPPSAAENWLWAGGVVTGDVVSDMFNDIVALNQSRAQAYKGTPFGTFPEDPCLDPFDLTFATGGSVADYDGDGLLDLYVTRFQRPNRLLHNNGDFTFTDTTDTAGIGATGPSLVSAWSDVDHDGDLDLFVGAYAQVQAYTDRTEGAEAGGSRLYLNQGAGRFVERVLPDEVQQAWVTAAVWVDVDRDGWQDLYLVSDTGAFTGNVLLLNESGTLVPDGNRHGLDLVMAGTGVAVGDLNGDRQPDFLLGETRNLRLLLSGVGYWYDASDELGIKPDLERGQQDPWAVDLGDVDDDGDLDALVTFGLTHADDPDAVYDQPDALFLQGDDGRFSDEAPALGLADTGVHRGPALADLNNDGWLDITKRDLTGPNLLYTSVCDPDQGWLRVQLVQPGMNSHALGARVTIEAGGREWTRTIGEAAAGFGNDGPPEAHVGIGELDRVDRVVVDWPDGRRSVVEDLLAHSILRIERDE